MLTAGKGGAYVRSALYTWAVTDGLVGLVSH